MTETPRQPTQRTSRAATRKTRRLRIVLAGMTMLGISVALVLFAFQDSLVFFYTPSDLAGRDIKPGQRVRLGGLVEEGSVRKSTDGLTTLFVITDLSSTVEVSFTGIPPDLFREGQGVVAEGTLEADGTMVAADVLAKHDENYMPAEVADALKKSGKWRGGGSAEGAAQ